MRAHRKKRMFGSAVVPRERAKVLGLLYENGGRIYHYQKSVGIGRLKAGRKVVGVGGREEENDGVEGLVLAPA